MQMRFFILVALLLVQIACYSNQNKINMQEITNNNTDSAIFGAGCFWCVEAVFQRLNGVLKVESGYAGGHVKNPTYREVCSGLTGHAEVVKITFDPTIVSFETLLQVFWQTHDPTTLNQQGADVGTQYRSVIFYLNPQQKEIAEKYKQELNEAKVFNKNIVTEITPYTNFYPAEDYHQNYYNQNANQPYCKFVIAPKLDKLDKIFMQKPEWKKP
jgi:peptide-methionine (S)-S-oxide reductase